MKENRINVVGVSPEAVAFIKKFMSQFVDDGENSFSLVPIIGLVHSSCHRDENGISIRGEHFVLGAINRSKIDDEFFFKADNLDIAIRIPPKSRFHGNYYFDLRDNELVNVNI